MIGYLSLGRDTFDIKYAKQKINIISKVLTKLDYKIYEFEKLILSQNDADKAIKFFKNKECEKYIVILKAIIEKNSLTDYDNANLLPTNLKKG